MEQQDQAILTKSLSQPIDACALSKADLQNLCERLQQWNFKAFEEEIKDDNFLNRVPEPLSEDMASLKSEFELKVAVHGVDGVTVFGTIPAVFDSPRFPDKVKRFHINSQLDLNDLHNWSPRNRFELLLDFTKPGPFNPSLFPVQFTPNASNIFVSGVDATWVNGVHGEVTDFIRKRKKFRRFLHQQRTSILLLLCGGFPFAFSMAGKLSGAIKALFGEPSGLLHSAVQIYVFFIALNLFGMLFDYARWIFPLVEYTDSTGGARKHRVIWIGALAGVLANFIHDLLKILPGFLTPNP